MKFFNISILLQEPFKNATVLAESLLPVDVEERIHTFGLSSPLNGKLASKTRPSASPQAKNSPHKFPNVYPKAVQHSSGMDLKIFSTTKILQKFVKPLTLS